VSTRTFIDVNGEPVEVVRKDIKNLHLAVYPPSGHIRIAVPKRVTDEAIRLAVIEKLGWIRQKQAGFAQQDRQSLREMVSGETHYFLGQRYLLEVIDQDRPPAIAVLNSTKLAMRVRPGTSTTRRRALLEDWYRTQLREQVTMMLPALEKKVGASASSWAIKRMRTRWGSCSIGHRRVWVNLELAKKSTSCIEYVLAHELIHLLERGHNPAFLSHMDRVMPQWRLRRDELNAAPLTHEDWKY
jgi:predicted metal-dependent hydrolase